MMEINLTFIDNLDILLYIVKKISLLSFNHIYLKQYSSIF